MYKISANISSPVGARQAIMNEPMAATFREMSVGAATLRNDGASDSAKALKIDIGAISISPQIKMNLNASPSLRDATAAITERTKTAASAHAQRNVLGLMALTMRLSGKRVRYH